jgi:exosortase/archaeosortase family protein
MSTIKEVFSHRGFVEFLIKSCVFILLLTLELFYVVSHENLIAVNTAWFSLNLFGFGTNTPIRLIIFAVLAFALLAKKKLLSVKEIPFRPVLSIVFLVVSVAFTWLLKTFRAAIGSDSLLIQNHFVIMFLMKFLLPTMLLLTLFIAVFDIKTIFFILKKLKKEISLCIGFTVVYYFLLSIFENVWPFFSSTVVFFVSFLLKLNGWQVVSNMVDPESPSLAVNNITISIGKPCSGIDSQILFITLFAIVLFIEWERINKFKAFGILVPGLIGMFIVNIIRIYLLYVVAVNVSVDFALSSFHSNIGWVLFVIYFILFEFLTYEWMRK